ncbi:hypothetical protein [Listeria booriae]|uniref:hypothetical protein n=1 Tax=Listeria booriae TaxID=1552123 RepID=UPI0016299E28|nr:hypothetical protein [Listeria booriae]MBC2106146.1 hypothetical protein [Listeria booriae]
MGYSIKKVIEVIEGKTEYPVFSTDIKKDEVENNPSFFVYTEKAGIDKGQNSNQYLKRFVLMFVSKDASDIDEIELSKALEVCGLIFDRSDVDYGRIADTEQEVLANTLYFHRILRVCS